MSDEIKGEGDATPDERALFTEPGELDVLADRIVSRWCAEWVGGGKDGNGFEIVLYEDEAREAFWHLQEIIKQEVGGYHE